MKTTGFICAAFCALALVSCVKENVTSQNEDGINAENRITRFTATGTDTKTGLSWNAESELMNVKWSTTDKININGVEFANTETETSMSAVFESEVGVEAATEYVAVYPSTATINPDGTILANLPAKQTAVKASFSDNLNVSVAKSETTELTFQNVLGMLRFEIAADNIYSVSISGNRGELLAGDIKISYDEDGKPVAKVVDNENASKTVTVVSGTDTKVAIPANTVVYAIVTPQTFEEGITMTFTTVNYATDAVVKASKQGTAVKTSSNPLTVNPSKFKNLGSVGAKMNWYYSGVTLHSQYYSPETDEYVSKQGNYLDLETCRTFWPIGSYKYCSEIDMGAAYSTNTGGFSITGFGANAKIASFYNEANLKTYAGGTVEAVDLFGVEGTGWTSRNATFFYLYSEDQMNDTKFEALKVTANPTTVDGTTTYYNYTDPDHLTGNNGRVQYLDGVITWNNGWTVKNVYVGFKTATGTPNKYGVIKIETASGNAKNSFIKFDYIIGK